MIRINNIIRFGSGISGGMQANKNDMDFFFVGSDWIEA